MKRLLLLTAVIEVGAGLALICCPSGTAVLLLGSSLDSPVGLTVARVAGAALLALGVACWLARGEARSLAATGLVVAMLLYNLAVVILLASGRIGSGLAGVGLWPAVVLHTGMGVWCITCLWRTPVQTGEDVKLTNQQNAEWRQP